MVEQKKIGHAVVIGAGTAGLITARVLRDRAAKVTLIERDPLTEETMARRGVPQGQHFHSMAGAGSQLLEQLFPSFLDDLDRAGVKIGDCGRDWLVYYFGMWQHRIPNGAPLLGCTRALLEQHLRRLLLLSPNIELRTGCSVRGLCMDKSTKRITGVRLSKKDDEASEEILSADLVVDASGRGSRTPTWLVELGLSAPPEEEVGIDLGYVSRLYKEPAGLQTDWQVIIMSPKPPAGCRGGFLQRISGGLLLCSLYGYSGDHPPLDEAGFLEFARSLAQPQIYEQLRHATPTSEPSLFKFPSSRRRYFERLSNMPDGLVVLGDAVCSVNPRFGQGMSMACLASAELGRCLDAQREPLLRGLSRRFQQKLAPLLYSPWTQVNSEDMRLEKTVGKRPPGLSAIHWYNERLTEICALEKDVSVEVTRVLYLLGSLNNLMSPRLVFKVLRRGLQRDRTVPSPDAPPPPPEQVPQFIMPPHPLLKRSYAAEG